MTFPRDNVILDKGLCYCWSIDASPRTGFYLSPAQVILNAANVHADRIDAPRRWASTTPTRPEPRGQRR